MATTTAATTAPARLTTPRFKVLGMIALADGQNVTLDRRQTTSRDWLFEQGLVQWNSKQKAYLATADGWRALAANSGNQEVGPELAALIDERTARTVEVQAEDDEPVEAEPTETPNDEIAAVLAQAPVRTATAETTPAGKVSKSCSCGKFWAGTTTQPEEGGDLVIENERNTGCDAMTTRQFAPGHDAKLVSFLVAAELDGLELHDGEGTSADAVTMLRNRGLGLLAHKAKRALEIGLRKAQAAKARAEAKAAKTTAPREVAAKVAKGETTAKK